MCFVLICNIFCSFWHILSNIISTTCIKTALFQKGMSFQKEETPAATCSAANRAWGQQNTIFWKRSVFPQTQKSACGRLFSRKQLFGLPIDTKMLSISRNIEYYILCVLNRVYWGIILPCLFPCGVPSWAEYVLAPLQASFYKYPFRREVQLGLMKLGVAVPTRVQERLPAPQTSRIGFMLL